MFPVVTVKKYIRYRILSMSGNYVLQITEQSHRNSDFGENGRDTFYASNGVTLASVGGPQWSPSENKLYVWGWVDSFENSMVYLPEKDIEKIEFAISEYNQTFDTCLPEDLFVIE